MSALPPSALDQLFLTARTYNEWSDVLWLDCGPMSGFDNAGVDHAFFSGTRIKSNFICSIGYGRAGTLFPRNPRLTFEEAGRFT
jgi:hypothetical protein